jgi:hypothetical protein
MIKPIDFSLNSQPKATGLGNNYYVLPSNAKDIQDLIEYRNMTFGIACIFKACYRFGQKPGVTELYDAQKMKWFAERKIAEIERELENDNLLKKEKLVFTYGGKAFTSSQSPNKRIEESEQRAKEQSCY